MKVTYILMSHHANSTGYLCNIPLPCFHYQRINFVELTQAPMASSVFQVTYQEMLSILDWLRELV